VHRANFQVLSLLFGDSPALLEDMRATCAVRRYEKGETILHQQDETRDVHILLRGRARAYLLAADGREVWMNEFAPGAMFGEVAAVTGEPRLCSVAASNRVETAMFRGDDFMRLMRSHGELGIALSRVLADRLRMTSQRLYHASVESLEGRVLVELLSRAEPCDDVDGYTHVIRPVPVIAEVARKIGSARESVSRVIAALGREEYLLRRDSEWLLKHPERLLALSM